MRVLVWRCLGARASPLLQSRFETDPSPDVGLGILQTAPPPHGVSLPRLASHALLDAEVEVRASAVRLRPIRQWSLGDDAKQVALADPSEEVRATLLQQWSVDSPEPASEYAQLGSSVESAARADDNKADDEWDACCDDERDDDCDRYEAERELLSIFGLDAG